MDYGKLTDNNGRSVDFSNVILIMTTNAGAFELSKPIIGFKNSKRIGEDKEAINKLFSPEFRNRLDAIIAFERLNQNSIYKVIEKMITQLETQLKDRKITISLTKDARSWIAKKGYSENMGARQMSRTIQEYIKKPLADKILFSDLSKGGKVSVDISQNNNNKNSNTSKSSKLNENNQKLIFIIKPNP